VGSIIWVQVLSDKLLWRLRAVCPRECQVALADVGFLEKEAQLLLDGEVNIHRLWLIETHDALVGVLYEVAIALFALLQGALGANQLRHIAQHAPSAPQ
jgi:hypothetical protein